jgi:AGCS family alanine or glycine:cation symporter
MSLAGRVREYCRCSYSDCLGGPELYSGCGWLLFWSKHRFVEATLAQIYKEKHLGEFEVDLLFISREDCVKWFAVLFAVVLIISAGVLLPGVQANSVADGIQNAFEIDTWKSGIVVSIFGAIVFGGVKESPNSQNLSFHNGHYLYCNCIGDHD